MTIEATVIQYLSRELFVPVSAQVPANRPDEFITVERVGGNKDWVLDWPNLAVQAWGTSRATAAALMDDVCDVLMRMSSLPEVARVDVGSIYNFPDPDSGQARYQTVVTVFVDRSIQ